MGRGKRTRVAALARELDVTKSALTSALAENVRQPRLAAVIDGDFSAVPISAFAAAGEKVAATPTRLRAEAQFAEAAGYRVYGTLAVCSDCRHRQRLDAPQAKAELAHHAVEQHQLTVTEFRKRGGGSTLVFIDQYQKVTGRVLEELFSDGRVRLSTPPSDSWLLDGRPVEWSALCDYALTLVEPDALQTAV